MLVLTRTEGQDVVLTRGGEEIRFRLIEVRRGGQGRVGVVAGTDWKIRRDDTPQRLPGPHTRLLEGPLDI